MTDLLHARIEGPADAQALVLLGSLGSTLDMWEPNLPALAERFHVVRMDNLGHGRSPAPAGPYSMKGLADTALATLDALGLDRVAWCGLSLGGMVGMYVASEHPERISSLALCCTTAYFADKEPWRQRIATVNADGTGAIAATVASRWFTADWAEAHPEVRDRAVGWIGDTSDAGYAASCEAIVAWDHRDRLPAIEAPTLVLGGADDLATPVDPHAELLAARIPGARLEIVPGGHVATYESAEKANRLLLEHF
ncbi:3-oxoadipate enol-lactonase [Pseudonocardia pini]|uniref:3-oxoadipate enol-lactonase n=1 Tax=Pseudonocardia pini TaxID=2758030 RepID=UPI0015F0B893|nr:3-oxoadipate enol-lactonase [Pseudonocardia pini]